MLIIAAFVLYVYVELGLASPATLFWHIAHNIHVYSSTPSISTLDICELSKNVHLYLPNIHMYTFVTLKNVDLI